jgi:serine O-acetyltransferase
MTNWRSDKERYGRLGWLLQPSYWAVATYRFGQWTKSAPTPIRFLAHALYFFAYSIVRLLTGIDLPRSSSIGPGLMIHHYGGVIINPQSVIGANCTLRHGITVGTKHDGGKVPIIGDNVTMGAYAQVLGGVKVGDGATIGALSLVIDDVPAGAVAVGVPARVINPRRAEEL